MNCELSRERLQEQIDGTLDPVIARDLERHLETCAECRGCAADLAAIADAAAAMSPIDVPEHVWLQLAGRWRAENPAAASAPASPAARRAYTAWHALAAAAVLAVAVGGGWIAWRATGSLDPAASGPTQVLLAKPGTAPGGGNAPDAALVETAQKDIEAAEQLYTRAIAGLEEAAANRKTVLEPQVVAMLDKNLAIIDEAIVESRAAVQTEPQSVIARESLFEALRKKVRLLQDTISLVGDISIGNQAGASRLAGT